ncbi:MAG TPA: exopolysaccharide biosynthesis protein [Candidatus Limnocylindrales bacterium]|nr:exopolysaccharide biosynthesis protein [Candidatus Limnocylindrales bacterium]
MAMTSVEFHDTQDSLSATLHAVAEGLPDGHVSVRYLFSTVGEHSMLLLCIILTIPFLTPLPLPGVSTVFGLMIMLISLGIILNRVPWLPRQVLDRPISSEHLGAVMKRGSQLSARIERFIKPRIRVLSATITVNRVNGMLLLLGGFLLIIPIPFIPLSNMLPGYGILFLSIGMVQHDGVMILLGYLLNLLTAVYFSAIAIGVVAAGQSIAVLFTEPGLILLPLIP